MIDGYIQFELVAFDGFGEAVSGIDPDGGGVSFDQGGGVTDRSFRQLFTSFTEDFPFQDALGCGTHE
ncbi:MAG: hypothetical protein BWY72_00862 [Bacteroidetes bacterium ADurb.Bin416]|nr:MAG: hypothetical protein BWY72_00862 [Bacteroidetes bacterium ADurb.Bin416]